MEEFEEVKNGRPTISVADIRNITATTTGISHSTIYTIIKEKNDLDASGTTLQTPGKKQPNKTPKKSNINQFTAADIKKNYSLYSTSEVLSLSGHVPPP